jgi:hypothetical protein
MKTRSGKTDPKYAINKPIHPPPKNTTEVLCSESLRKGSKTNVLVIHAPSVNKSSVVRSLVIPATEKRTDETAPM